VTGTPASVCVGWVVCKAAAARAVVRGTPVKGAPSWGGGGGGPTAPPGSTGPSILVFVSGLLVPLLELLFCVLLAEGVVGVAVLRLEGVEELLVAPGTTVVAGATAVGGCCWGWWPFRLASPF